MPDKSARDKLRAKRKELLSQREDVASAAGFLGMFIGMVLLVLAYILLLQAIGWEESMGEGIALVFNVIVLCVLVLVGMFAPLLLMQKWIERAWHRQYLRIWAYLKHTDAASLVMDQERWEPVFAILDSQPWLKLSGVRVPQSLDEQIELASDYWPVFIALARGDQRRLRWHVLLGSAGRLADEAALFFFNGCVAYLLLVLTGFFLFIPLLPFMAVTLFLYTRHQGAQHALIDYFLDDPGVGVWKVKPPRGLGKRVK